MPNIGGPELLVILVVALLVLGPSRLPDAARQVGSAIGQIRRVSSGFQAELQNAMQEPVTGDSASVREVIDAPVTTSQAVQRPRRDRPLRAASRATGSETA